MVRTVEAKGAELVIVLFPWTKEEGVDKNLGENSLEDREHPLLNLDEKKLENDIAGLNVISWQILNDI